MATTCLQVESLLPAYEEGDLAPDERRRLERHMASCARCRRVLEGLRESWARLGEWPDVQPSPSYRAHFWQAVGRDEERRRWGWAGLLLGHRWAPMSFSALLAVVFLSGTLWVGMLPKAGPSAAPAPPVPVALAPGGPLDTLPDPFATPQAAFPGPGLGHTEGHLSGEILDQALAAAVPLR